MKDVHTANAPSALRKRDPAWARDFEAILEAYNEAGGKVTALRSDRIASMVINADQVLAVNEIPGVQVETSQIPSGVKARIAVDPGTQLEYPIHLCFGMVSEEGKQEIVPEFEIGEGAEVGFLAHCTFPNAIDLSHLMEAHIHVGPGATMRYVERHYHGPQGGIKVLPTVHVDVGEGARFENEFSLIHGRVGRMEIKLEADVEARGATELSTKAYGLADDVIRVEEIVRLNGADARGVTKTRVAVRDQATSEIYTTAEGNAPGARGHMDCTEIVRGEAVARNVPSVVVRHDQARVTHEAAIGSVSRKELETLMSRGLSEEEAVDILIRGMLE